MKIKIKPTMLWNEAPDTIGVEDLRKILGIGKNQANAIFNIKDFPRIPGGGLKAEKEVAKLYIQGFKIKDNQKNTLEYLILQELRKLNQKFTNEGVESFEEIN